MAYRTKYDSYEFMVMPFGLYNTLATFITLINSIFYKKSDEFVVVYIDDILVFFKSDKRHEVHLKIVIEKLKENQLYANEERSIFYLEKLEYMRYINNDKDLKP